MHQTGSTKDDGVPSDDLVPRLDLGPVLPTLASARNRITAVRPTAYARTRNAIDGAVSGLSPYITHGFVNLAEVLAGVNTHHAIAVQHKFVYELGWREFFRHVWQHQGTAIFKSLHDGPLPERAYDSELPVDVREGRTGLQVVDMAVRELYATGTLHNHARMWLASYVVHLRKVHWRAGADWLYAHLLDGDLASNYLSWQWVAGTGSSKPYIFNAENVARYAPTTWHSPGSIVDTSYEALDLMARSPGERASVPQEPSTHRSGHAEPAVLTQPPEWVGATSPKADIVDGRDVWLLHPWNLGELPADLSPDTMVIGLYLSDFHHHWPWSERRWRFVGTRMAELTDICWHGDAAAIGLALGTARRVRSVADHHLLPWLAQWAACSPAPMLFPKVDHPCASFSQWWSRATRGLDTAADLQALNQASSQ